MYKVEKRKGPTYITENYTQLFVITYKGKEFEKRIHTHIIYVHLFTAIHLNHYKSPILQF